MVQSVDLTTGTGEDTFELDNVGGAITSVTVNGGAEPSGMGDTFNVTPKAGITFQVNGNDPDMVDFGDTLNITQIPVIDLPLIFGATSDGFWDNNPALGRIDWTSIEGFTLNGTPFDAGELYVETTPDDDRVILNAWAGKSDVVSLEINGVTYAPYHGVETIVVDAKAGDDHIGVAANLCLPTELYGGAGNDYIASGPKDDIVVGGSGNDRLLGGGGDDTIIGLGGTDRIDGRDGNDILFGDAGEYDDGNGGVITVDLDAGDVEGNDMIVGGTGNDTIDGGGGNDELAGGSGSDIVKGGDGDDELTGESGHDLLFGGAGKDLALGATRP